MAWLRVFELKSSRNEWLSEDRLRNNVNLKGEILLFAYYCHLTHSNRNHHQMNVLRILRAFVWVWLLMSEEGKEREGGM